MRDEVASEARPDMRTEHRQAGRDRHLLSTGAWPGYRARIRVFVTLTIAQTALLSETWACPIADRITCPVAGPAAVQMIQQIAGQAPD